MSSVPDSSAGSLGGQGKHCKRGGQEDGAASQSTVVSELLGLGDWSLVFSVFLQSSFSPLTFWAG